MLEKISSNLSISTGSPVTHHYIFSPCNPRQTTPLRNFGTWTAERREDFDDFLGVAETSSAATWRMVMANQGGKNHSLAQQNTTPANSQPPPPPKKKTVPPPPPKKKNRFESCVWIW